MGGRLRRALAALAGCFIQNDGTGCGDVQRGDAAGHGNAKQVVAGAAGEVVKPFTFAAEDDDGVGGPVVGVVVDGSALVEADAPDVVLLELLEGADEIDDAGDAHVLGGAGGGFDGDSAQGGGAPLGEDDAINPGTIGGADKRAEILGIFDSVECEQESGGGGVAGLGEEVLEGEELALAHDGDDTLVAGCFGHAGELVAVLKAHSNAVLTTEVNDALEFLRCAVLLTFAADANMVKTAIASAESFFYWVQSE